jgi:hypothetical protein
VVDGGGESGIETLEVGGVGDLAGIGDRLDAGRDDRFELRQPLAEAGRKQHPRLLDGKRARRRSTRTPRDGGA